MHDGRRHSTIQMDRQLHLPHITTTESYEKELKVITSWHRKYDSSNSHEGCCEYILKIKNSSGDEIANVNFYAVRPEATRIRRNNAITPFKVIQGHRFWYQSKAHLLCGFLLVINTNLPPILHRFRDIAIDTSKIAILGYPSCV